MLIENINKNLLNETVLDIAEDLTQAKIIENFFVEFNNIYKQDIEKIATLAVAVAKEYKLRLARN